jgi:hypothetical protein
MLLVIRHQCRSGRNGDCKDRRYHVIDESCDNYIVPRLRAMSIADDLSVYGYHIVSSGNADFAEVLCLSILWHPDIATIVILFQCHGLGQPHHCFPF